MAKPSDIAGLKIWLDAKDLNLSVGDSVTNWSGKGGTTISAIGASGTNKSPTLRSFNDRNYVYFDGAIAQRMDLSENIFANNNPITIFMMIHGLKNGHIFGFSTSTTPYYTYLKGIALQGGKYGVSARSNGTGSLIETSNIDYLSKTKTEMLSITIGDKNTSIKTLSEAKMVNTTSNIGFYNYPKATIGASDGSNSNVFLEPFGGYIGEIIVYDKILTDPEIVSIENYLKTKWFIQNKSFISMIDGYKKLIEGSKEIPFEDGLMTPKMTSYIAPSGNVYGSIDSFYPPWWAFDQTNGNYYLRKSTSAWISYRFPNGKILKKYTIKIGVSESSLAPKNWTISASNNSTDGINGTWTTIDTKVGVTFASDEKKEFIVSNGSTYNHYKIDITLNGGGAETRIQELEFIGITPYSPAIPSKFQTVSTTLPTLTQFQTEGMDDLSIFDRKIQKVLESPKTMTSSVLGTGNVYKSSVDLKKYFDLRKIEVK